MSSSEPFKTDKTSKVSIIDVYLICGIKMKIQKYLLDNICTVHFHDILQKTAL